MNRQSSCCSRADGMSDDAIAAAFHIEVCTLREYVERLFRACNRTAAVGAALRAVGRMLDKG